jgi:hypothetical protein
MLTVCIIYTVRVAIVLEIKTRTLRKGRRGENME